MLLPPRKDLALATHAVSGLSADCSYQLDFITPGISPFSARPRKHRRHKPNLRRYARGRPQMLQRLRCWVENLGFLFVLAIFAVVAIVSFLLSERHSHMLQQHAGLVIVAGGGHNGHVHALEFI